MIRIKNILCFGDSLTAGYGLPSSQAYPALIQQRIQANRFPYQVINAGVNGDTSARGVQRIEDYLTEPIDVLLLELGINDLFQGIYPEQISQNLQRIIDRIREVNPACRLVVAGMEVPATIAGSFLASTFLSSSLITAFRHVFEEIASRNGAAYIPFLLKGVAGHARLNQRDGIHPTAEGQKLIASTVWEVLSAVL